ncbi:MAG: RND family efflux transporter MFP subunit [Pseudohongiellaceae bacterium]
MVGNPFIIKTFALFNRIRQLPGGLPLMIVALVLVIVYLLILTRPQLKPIDIAERVWVVETINARLENLSPDLTLYGIVFAGRQSDLRAQVTGNVVKVGEKYKQGGWVNAGDLLVQIDTFDYDNALAESNAQLAQARSKLELLKRDYVRAKELYRKKDASRQFLDTAELNLEQQSAIVTQREIQQKQSQRDLDQTQLLSPFDGVIDEVSAELGMQLSSNDKVALVIDTQRLEVRFSLSNAQFGRILQQDGGVIGRPIAISWQVGKKQLRYQGKIDRQGAQISSESGGIDMYAVITSSNNTLKKAPLRPGAFVKVIVADRSYDNVISVPSQAIYQGDEIYIVRDQRLQARKVNIVGRDGSQLLIRNNDDQALLANDEIVITQIREGGVGVKVESRPRPATKQVQ